ncbi:MAG: aminotransferase class I/II-fold pyridoxal phosphate-dependent enzyme [Flavitalea sp.]
MQTAKRLEGIGEYYFSQKLREIAQLNAAGKDIINLGIGSPDLPPHPDVIRVLAEESAKPNVHAYQAYKGVPALRNAFSNWYKKWYDVHLDPETEILPLIGSKEGIMHVCMTYLQDGDEVLVPDPGYPTYSSAVKLAGGKCIGYELKAANNWQPDFDALQKQTTKNTKMFFVNYPQMPTGQLPDKALFEKIIEFAKKNNILVVHDNPYSFILNDKPMSILSVEGAKEVAVELNSLSKSHNMAGWRIGVLCGAKQRIDEVMRFKSNMDSGMFLPMQLAAAKALELGREWHDELNAVYLKRSKLAQELLNITGCTTAPGQAGMFLWAAIPNRYKDGYALSDEILYQSNVFITPGSIFGNAGSNYVRISLCSKEEKLKEAIERIKSHLS